jgi:hypothetical protein
MVKLKREGKSITYFKVHVLTLNGLTAISIEPTYV